MIKIAEGIKVKLGLPKGPVSMKDIEGLPESQRLSLISALDNGHPISGYTPSPRLQRQLTNASPVARAFTLYATRRAMADVYKKNPHLQRLTMQNERGLPLIDRSV